MFSDIVDKIGRELDLNMNSTKQVEKVYDWCNAIYRNVVHSDQFPWRMRDIPLITKPVGEGTSFTLTYGSVSMGGNAQDGSIDSFSAKNFVLVEGYDVPLEIDSALYLGDPTYAAAIQLNDVCPFASGTYDVEVPHCRYAIDEMREDWIIGVYNHTDEIPLTRIYPNDHLAYLQRGMKNPSAPTHYYTEAVDDNKSALLCLSPAPNAAYELTIRTLLGTSELTVDTVTTIVPTEFETDLFVFGVGLLYSMSHKDETGKANYGSLYQKVLDQLNSSAKKQPGRRKVMMGYLARSTRVVDPDVAVDSDWSF